MCAISICLNRKMITNLSALNKKLFAMSSPSRKRLGNKTGKDN